MMKLRRYIIFGFILLGVTLGSLFHLFTKPNRHVAEITDLGKEFKIELLDAISRAQRIEVVEHSWLYDFGDEKGELVEDPAFVEYKRMEFTPVLKSSFMTAIKSMPVAPKNDFSPCAFSPHHSIELINQDGSKSIIRVCFTCGSNEWDGRSVVPPNDFQDVIRNFIEPLGFQAFSEWGKIAKTEVSDVSARWIKDKSLNDFQLLRSKLAQSATTHDVEILFGEPHGHTQDNGKEFFEYITYEQGQETSCWTAVFDEQGMLLLWHKDR